MAIKTMIEINLRFMVSPFPAITHWLLARAKVPPEQANRRSDLTRTYLNARLQLKVKFYGIFKSEFIDSS